jgi:hypothetical protein
MIMSTITTKEATLTFFGEWGAGGPVLLTHHDGRQVRFGPPRHPMLLSALLRLLRCDVNRPSRKSSPTFADHSTLPRSAQ